MCSGLVRIAAAVTGGEWTGLSVEGVLLVLMVLNVMDGPLDEVERLVGHLLLGSKGVFFLANLLQ